MLITLLAYTPESHMAVATGFGQLFRGIGQVGGVAIASAIFQSRLDSELRQRINVPNAEEIIQRIRQNARLVGTLPPDIQRHARDSYAASLKDVFIFASCSTLLAFLVRLPIPEADLDKRPRSNSNPAPPSVQPVAAAATTAPQSLAAPIAEANTSPASSGTATPDDVDSDLDDDNDNERSAFTYGTLPRARPIMRPRRRISTFESTEGGMDLESSRVGGSARGSQAFSI
ncbi:hypothetical protein AAF712_007048 [Marasmius tenuissimus]|uniref:Uncharacterized protein n=1 Tax=Marasmius tenuissimus TaxID=585030 RepID=A0ABR3A045_9AGAR